MQGTIPDFKPHHRLSAAKELLRRGFDTPVPADAGNSAATQSDPEQSAPAEKTTAAPRSWTHILEGRYAGYPVGYNRYETEYGPFDFRSYDDEEYHFDTHGSRALTHISGGEEAASAVHKTVFDFRFAAWQLAKATGQDRDRCDHLIKIPDDCPQPENIYGYQALRQIFGTEQAARIAAWAAAGNTTGSKPPWPPASYLKYPNPRPGPRPRTPSGTNRRRNCTRKTGRRRTRNLTLPMRPS